MAIFSYGFFISQCKDFPEKRDIKISFQCHTRYLKETVHPWIQGKHSYTVSPALWDQRLLDQCQVWLLFHASTFLTSPQIICVEFPIPPIKDDKFFNKLENKRIQQFDSFTPIKKKKKRKEKKKKSILNINILHWFRGSILVG